MSPNVHSLLHLCPAVMRFGPLEQFSAFDFESYLGGLLNLVRRKRDYLAQIVKRITEINFFGPHNVAAEEPNPRLSKPHSSGPLAMLRGQQFKSMRFSYWTISCHPANNCVVLSNGSVVLVENIVQVEDQIRIVCRKFQLKTDLYKYPLDSRLLDIYQVGELSKNLESWPIQNISCKLFRLPILQVKKSKLRRAKRKKFAVFPMRLTIHEQI